MNLYTLYLICTCISFFSCNDQSMIILSSKKKIFVGVGTALIMDFKSVGKVSSVTMKGNEYIYTVKLNEKIDLRVNAYIEVSYPLIGDKPNLRILNRGTSSSASIDDTIEIKAPLVKEKRSGDTSDVSNILRAIADSIDAHK